MYPSDILNLAGWELQQPVNGKFSIINNLKNYSSPDYFYSDADTVYLKINAGGPHSNGSIYPRSELASLNSFDSVNGGKMEVLIAVLRLPLVVPQVCIAQVKLPGHLEFAVDVQGDRLVVRNIDASTHDIGPYKLGTFLDLQVLVKDNICEVSVDGVIKGHWSNSFQTAYFKTGNYMQSNVAKGELPATTSLVGIKKLIV